MLQKIENYMDRNLLDEAKKRQEFLNAQNIEQNPIEQKPDFFNPDQLKLSSLKYQALLDAGWCVVSHPGELGGNRANYEIARKESAISGKYRIFEDHLPGYLHLKKVNADETPNRIIAYLFRDENPQPITYPQIIELRY